jgi:tripartite-type tricarboxylate transporter receptor subunit TctC
VNLHAGAIVVNAAPGMNIDQLARAVAKALGKAARAKQNANAIYSG